MLSDTFPKLYNVKYLSLIDASSDYHNLNFNERSSHLTTFACQFGSNRYKRLPLEQHPQVTCFNKIFKLLPNVFGIADDILVVGYDGDGKDHNKTL